MIKNIIRALRLPFLAASVLPFVFGSLIEREGFNLPGFLCGLIAASFAHLSANLINDYADSKSGGDWRDMNFYKFFGGSKLIQEGVFPEKFYLRLAVIFAAVSAVSAIFLALILGRVSVIGFFLTIILLSWAYSCKPIKLSYRLLGEPAIFLLFGPALVMGGYFIQTGIFPDPKSLLLSLPFGLLTAAILFANEVPDFDDDSKTHKFNWVGLTMKRSWALYLALELGAFVSIGLSFLLGYLSPAALASFIFIFPALKAAGILKMNFGNKRALIESSKLTIAIQAFVSLILIAAVL